MPRIVIDTDGVRTLAQYTRGAVDQVAQIRLELMRAERELNHQVGADAYGPLLARLTDLVTVLSDDHRSLVQEVLTLEAEEGEVPPATGASAASTPAVLEKQPLVLGNLLVLASVGGPPLKLSAVGAPPAPPPQPWNSTWVSAGGVIPVGSPTRPLTPAEQSGVEPDGFGPKWESRSSADASFSHEEGIRSSSGRQADGTQYGSWEAYQRVQASAHVSGSGLQGPLHYQGEAGIEAEAAADVHVWYRSGPDGVTVGGEASAEVHVHAYTAGEVGVDGVGSISGSAEADAGARANASGQVSVGKDGVSASYEAGAYAGAEAGAGGQLDAGPLQTQYGARVGTGVGVEAQGGVSLGLDDIGFSLHATLGLGLSLGIDLDFHIDPGAILDGIGSVFEDPLGTLEDVVNAPVDLIGSIGDLFDGDDAASTAMAQASQATEVFDQAAHSTDQAKQVLDQAEHAADQARQAADQAKAAVEQASSILDPRRLG